MSTQSETHQQLQALRNKKANVKQKIQEAERRLREVEKAVPPPDRYERHMGECMAGNVRIWCVQYVKSPRANLRQDLAREVAGLRAQMNRLMHRERELARRAQTRKQADRRSGELSKRLDEALDNAAQKSMRGEDNDLEETLAGLLAESEEVLKQYVTILQGNPSVENVSLVLKHLEVPTTLGGDGTGEATSAAWRALEHAVGTLVQQAQNDFDRVPSTANFDRLLGRLQLSAQLIGGHGLNTPSDFRPVNSRHVVEPGDTLAKIAQRYYGKANFWPWIYLENFQSLDPRHLPAGVTVRLP